MVKGTQDNFTFAISYSVLIAYHAVWLLEQHFMTVTVVAHSQRKRKHVRVREGQRGVQASSCHTVHPCRYSRANPVRWVAASHLDAGRFMRFEKSWTLSPNRAHSLLASLLTIGRQLGCPPCFL